MFIVFTQVFNWTLTFGSCLTLLFLFWNGTTSIKMISPSRNHRESWKSSLPQMATSIRRIPWKFPSNAHGNSPCSRGFPMAWQASIQELAVKLSAGSLAGFCWPLIAMKKDGKMWVFQMESMGGSRQFHPICTLFQHFTSVIFVSMYFHLHRNSEILVVIYPRETAKILRYIMPCLNSV